MIKLSSVVVVPCARWNSTPPAIASGSPEVKLCPPPPWTCTSTNPATMVQPPLPMAVEGAMPPPTWAIRSPAVSTQPRTTDVGVTTRPAMITA